MPFTGDDHNLPAGTIIPNGTASDAVTQHNAPFTDVSDALSELAVRVTGKQAASANLDEYAAVNPTAAGLALLDDASADAQLTTLGGSVDGIASFKLGVNVSWNASDLSSKIIGSAIASSAVNSGTGTITSVAHGLKTGFSVITTTAVNGLALNTLYRVIRVDDDNYKLATTWANAKAGTNVTLTGTSATTVKQHYDPLQAKYITPSADISGASGAWVRSGKITAYDANAVGDGVTDDTEALQNILTVSRGRTAHIDDGQFKITLPLWTAADKTHVCLSHDAEIIHVTPNYIALNLAHSNCRVSGGKGGGFTGPSVFDPATGAVTPSYAVIWATGDGCEVEGTRITNIRRIGIGFKDANRWSVKDCAIDGNQPRPTFPLLTTVHFGIFGDPSSASGLGRVNVSGNEISGCTTGVSVANYGAGPVHMRSVLIHGNSFEDMWDHCVYTNYSGGAVITDNTSHRCHTPVACSGPNNIVDGWTVYTEAGSPDERDIAAAISFRDAVGCIARNITIKGNGDSVAGQTVIGVDFLNVGAVAMNGNLVDGVRMENVSGAAQAVRIVASQPHYGNAISNVFFDGIPRDNLGVVAIEGSVGYGTSIDHINVIQKGGLGACAVFGRFSGGRVTNIQHEIAFNRSSGFATTVYSVFLFDSNDTTVDGVQVYNRAGSGEYTNCVGVAEGTAGARNEVSNVKENEALATGQTFVHVSPLSSATKMFVRLAGSAAPAYLARAGSTYIRYAGTTQWFNSADGNNWTTTWP